MLVLATLAVGYTLWAAQDVLLPVLLAMFFALVGNPIIRVLRRLYVPRFLGALVVLLGGMAATGLLAHKMLPSAMEWAQQAPREMRQLAPKLRELTKPVQDANKAAENFARAAGGQTGKQPQVVHTAPLDRAQQELPLAAGVYVPPKTALRSGSQRIRNFKRL